LISGGVCHLDQMEKVEIKAVFKYPCNKGMSPRKSMRTSWIHLEGSPYYSTVKQCAVEFKRDRESIWDDEGPKEDTNDETAEAVHDLVMCDRRRDMWSIAREVDISNSMSMICQKFPLDGSSDSWLTTKNERGMTFQDIFVSLRGWTWSLRSRIKKIEHAVEAPWLKPTKKAKRVPAGKMMASLFGIVRG
jgi:hypothetical protein